MERILVVEDEPLIYDAIKAALTFRGGYAFAYAPDGDAAIRELTDRPPDLAFIDVYLPKRSGIEVADVAAAQQVPVILMSGHPEVLTNPEKYRFPISRQALSAELPARTLRRAGGGGGALEAVAGGPARAGFIDCRRPPLGRGRRALATALQSALGRDPEGSAQLLMKLRSRSARRKFDHPIAVAIARNRLPSAAGRG